MRRMESRSYRPGGMGLRRRGSLPTGHKPEGSQHGRALGDSQTLVGYDRPCPHGYIWELFVALQ